MPRRMSRTSKHLVSFLALVGGFFLLSLLFPVISEIWTYLGSFGNLARAAFVLLLPVALIEVVVHWMPGNTNS